MNKHDICAEIVQIAQDLSIEVGIIFIDGEVIQWNHWIIIPTDGYIEISGSGPFSISLIKAIKLNPIETRYIGRLVPDKKIDHSMTILQKLELANIQYQLDESLIIVNLSMINIISERPE